MLLAASNQPCGRHSIGGRQTKGNAASVRRRRQNEQRTASTWSANLHCRVAVVAQTEQEAAPSRYRCARPETNRRPLLKHSPACAGSQRNRDGDPNAIEESHNDRRNPSRRALLLDLLAGEQGRRDRRPLMASFRLRATTRWSTPTDAHTGAPFRGTIDQRPPRHPRRDPCRSRRHGHWHLAACPRLVEPPSFGTSFVRDFGFRS